MSRTPRTADRGILNGEESSLSRQRRAAGLIAPRRVRVFSFEDGTIHQSDDLDRIDDILAQDGQLVWVDIQAPTDEDVVQLQSELNCHPLILEDMRHSMQRPKVSEYEGSLLIVFYAVSRAGGHVLLRELRIMTGRHYVVTLHNQEMPEIDESVLRWQRNTELIRSSGIGVMLYSLFDTIVDGYFPVLDATSDQIERVETNVFRGRQANDLRDMLQIRKDLQRLRRFAGPCRDVLLQIIRHEAPAFGQQTPVFFQDVFDHMQRALDMIDAQRDILISVADVHLTFVSNNLSTVMKRMTFFATVLMSMSLIAGIYGMNFDNMPELHWELGYLWALGLMAVTGGTLAWFFRRVGWW
ncbi:MAG: magnesium/cobalt transporter CorA [Dehalococcoidia bacterium]